MAKLTRSLKRQRTVELVFWPSWESSQRAVRDGDLGCIDMGAEGDRSRSREERERAAAAVGRGSSGSGVGDLAKALREAMAGMDLATKTDMSKLATKEDMADFERGGFNQSSHRRARGPNQQT